ncbi:hypothetical protein Pfo_008412 [Paulownia fortunei]|nr:hypothetical protein Pfo_008412 [Paulownia fortunei]
MEEGLDVILEHIHLLIADIFEFSNLLPFTTKANITSKTAAVDSLFIVDSLLYDLEDLLNQDDTLLADTKDQIKILHQELMFLKSLLKGIKVPRRSEMEELKEPVMQMRDVAYEAEYLINSFWVGDSTLWYFSIRLPHVIHKIKLIGTGLQEIKMNYDDGGLKVAKDFSAQLSLQTKRNSEDSHLYVQNMKLLRVLDVQPSFDHCELVGIDHLVHLRYLSVNYMPKSIGNLVNLEFLLVKTRKAVYIPSVIVKMLKLRYLHLTTLAVFDEDCNTSQINNLESFSNVSISKHKDEEMLKCSPHLRRLKCICEPLISEGNGAYHYPDRRFLTQLESLNFKFHGGNKMAKINFPWNIKKLTLSGLGLSWGKMSTIGRLPNLEVLKLGKNAIVRETWDTRDAELQQPRFLKMELLNLAQWNVASTQHFPKLQRLVLHKCYNLQQIPCEMGEIVTLQLIEVELCPNAVAESALRIQQEQWDLGNEELRVILSDVRAHSF